METGACELDTDDALTVGERLGNMDNATLGLEFAFLSAGQTVLGRDADLQIRANRHVEASAKCGAAAAKILTGCIFLEGKTTRVATPDT